MKRLAIIGCLLASVAVAQELPNGGMNMTAAERAFINQKMMNMQEKIDELDKAYRTLKEKTGCA